MKNLKLKVNGIHCNGCANKIKNGVDSLDKESTVNVDVESGLVQIKTISESVSVADLKFKITELGFSIESIEIE